MDRGTLQNRIKVDLNHYVGTHAIESVRCRAEHLVPGESYLCIAAPSNGRKAIRLLVSVHGSNYSILKPS